MNAILLQLKKPNASTATLDLLHVLEANLDLEIPEKELHDNLELWSDPVLIASLVDLLALQKKNEDDFRDLQSTID